jgi:molecular chaperone DnaJ
MVTASPCPTCGGAGEEIVSPCPDCRGQGRKLEERSFMVEVPAGVDDGSTLRLSGRGASGARGGPPGDVYVHIRVTPDPRFVRAGVDLQHELHVAFTQAALGAEIECPTLDGPEVLVLPPGTQTGRQFRLRHHGVPHLQGRGRGDLVVHVVVDTPVDLSPEQEELVRRLAAERGEAVAPTGSGLFSKIRGAFK